MARKWLSGALAFAMIFGCSAPVALAEETPVEVVEQESLEGVEQESLEGVEQYAVYAPSLATTSIKLNEKGDKVEVKVNDAGAVATVVADKNDGYVSFSYADGILTVTADKDLDGGYTKTTYTLTFSNTNDSYNNTVEITVDKGTAPVINQSSKSSVSKTLESSASTDAIFNKSGQIEVLVGGSGNVAYTTTEEKAPTVSVVLSNSAQKYFTYSTSDVKTGDKVTGTKITFKATAAMTKSEIDQMKGSGLWPQARVTVTYSGAKTVEDTWYLPVVNPDYSLTPTNITLTSNKTTAKVGEEVSIAAKVMVDDGFGGETTADYYSAIEWYVNGKKVDASPFDITNALGTEVGEFRKDRKSVV